MSLASDANQSTCGRAKDNNFLADPARPDLSLCRIPKLAGKLYQTSYRNA